MPAEPLCDIYLHGVVFFVEDSEVFFQRSRAGLAISAMSSNRNRQFDYMVLRAPPHLVIVEDQL